jgi:AraC-like DNA-binding protein/HAMP domain-containing protein
MRAIEELRKKYKRQPLMSVYYMYFAMLIVIPICLILSIVLIFLNQKFKQQGLDNIHQAQETIVTELQSELKNSSIKLSHLVYVNDNEIMNLAAKTDTTDTNERYNQEVLLNKSVNFLMEPIKDTMSIAFFMNSGRVTYFRNDLKLPVSETSEASWYENALENKNQVYIGSYNIGDVNDLYQNGETNTLILVYAIAPGAEIDRSRQIEMVCSYQISQVADRIKQYNKRYLNHQNKLGITRIVDADGRIVYEDQKIKSKDGLIKVTTSHAVNDTKWIIESYVSPGVLTEDFRNYALPAFLTAVFILLLAGYFSRFFLSGIVRPVERMRDGLKKLEEGQLDVHLQAEGTREVRMMTHQFNAMVSWLRSCIKDYENRVNAQEIDDEELFHKLVKGDITPHEAMKKSKYIFGEQYLLYIIMTDAEEPDLHAILDKNPRFISRCLLYRARSGLYVCMYRIEGEDYKNSIVDMINAIGDALYREHELSLSLCIGSKRSSPDDFESALQDAFASGVLRSILGDQGYIDMEETGDYWREVIQLSKEYEKLAKAAYAVDEKNFHLEKSKLFTRLEQENIEAGKQHVYAAILAVSEQFKLHNADFAKVFGEPYNYIDKLERIIMSRNLKLWVSNYFAWIMDYSFTKLEIHETDIIVKAKRYIANNFDNPQLKLSHIAEYIGLNEKYFTNRFTKEAGETFSSYLAGVRIEKAKELLRTTDFKVYEVAEMVGYQNTEHFTRMFKKVCKISPTAFRKSE